MIDLDPDLKTEQYGTLSVTVAEPYTLFGDAGSDLSDTYKQS
jgi:hypothetical protein